MAYSTQKPDSPIGTTYPEPLNVVINTGASLGRSNLDVRQASVQAASVMTRIAVQAEPRSVANAFGSEKITAS